ncbi:MAG: hypothetical protein IT206_03330 [Fimbriimonadaceae bacterium]|nr:hypothetical protein [Fimbriimonadaceae bacterium]
MRGLFPTFIRWYLRLFPWEASGRIYEYIGIRWIDRQLAGVFHEPPIERYGAGDTLPRAYVLKRLLRGQYSEVVNAMCGLIYFGLVITCWSGNFPGLGFFALLITAHHFLIVPIERYKRALLTEWLNHPQALTDGAADLESPYLRTRQELTHWYFRPLPFESERFYARIGVQSYRIFVYWLTGLIESGASEEAKAQAPNYLKNPSIEQLDEFEKGTRTSETVHLLGIVEHLPFAVAFLAKPYWPGVAVMIGIGYLNVYAIFLQRQHRARLFKLLLRRADKMETKRA